MSDRDRIEIFAALDDSVILSREQADQIEAALNELLDAIPAGFLQMRHARAHRQALAMLRRVRERTA